MTWLARFIRNRLGETSSQIAYVLLAIAATGVIALAFARHRNQPVWVEVKTAAGAAAWLFSIPDRWFGLTFTFGSRLFARIRPSPPPAAAPATQESTMSVVTTISEIVTEAPDFIKVAQDGIAVAQAIEAKNFAAIVAGFPTYEADLVKVYNDIKALGVAQAVAAGTVVAQ